ncbi:30S ribosomal protein S14 [Prauserella marina]|uniref:Small ribosomal subunit protein uS14 n=1 Tax=Prauserella marina TaxID=530584 RepID=A0A222VQ56_9PSEU|nr:30S ribosomal protein S14 [Prauserella marina]ASR36045.1 30S ribosomal protein S14 [Prauserella marina]PWV83998.1 SSU ribosomal protein S14P [Prauserella marina]SDC32822.1 small subunit ribosomal protein S14 [Prauserella marina]
MARASVIARNRRRELLVARFAARRAELRARARSPLADEGERAAARAALAALPRDACPVRVRNRDGVDGRPRGYLRAFGLSRIRVRQLAHRGELPGVAPARR